LDQLARQPQWLGAQTGMLAVLHTWGQKLDLHPHVHCIVPGGGMSQNGNWVASKKGFFIPVGVLSAVFRGKFLAALKQLFQNGELSFFGSAATLENSPDFFALIKKLYSTKWIVYAKAPFGGPMMVLRYLGRYTHRIAISNRRIISVSEKKLLSHIRIEATTIGIKSLPWIQGSLSAGFCSMYYHMAFIKSATSAYWPSGIENQSSLRFNSN
jgi:hypothetical protein